MTVAFFLKGLAFVYWSVVRKLYFVQNFTGRIEENITFSWKEVQIFKGSSEAAKINKELHYGAVVEVPVVILVEVHCRSSPYMKVRTK